MIAPPISKDFVELIFSRIVAKGDTLFLRHHPHFDTTALVLCWCMVLLTIAGLWLLLRRQYVALLLLGTAVWIAALESLLGLGGGWAMLESSERYGFLPNYLLQLALIVGATAALANVQRTIAGMLLMLTFCSGAIDFVLLPLRFKTTWQGEPWREQVLRWERDPATPLHTFPLGWPPYVLAPRRQ